MNQQVLPIEQLHCVSLIEEALAHEPSQVQYAHFPSCPEPIRIIRAADVLYIPRLRLQVMSGGAVPLEALLDPSTLDLERVYTFPELDYNFEEPFSTRYRAEEVCILSNSWSMNFFHWITEELIKVTVLERSGFSGSYVLYDQPDFSREFLECLGIPAERVLVIGDEPTVFQTAVFMTPLNVTKLLKYPGVFFMLRSDLLKVADYGHTATPRKIWLHRGQQANSGRELINAEEVHSLVERYGFEVVDMGAHPLRHQIAIANRAEVIMGPHASAFVHAAFMEPRSTVVECYSPEFINSGGFCQEICSLLRHRYFMLVPANAYGVYPYGQRLKLNCFQLELLLQSLEL